MTRTMITVAATLGLAATASADITGVYTVNYSVTAEDFGGASVTVNVQDLYVSSDDAADTVIAALSLNLVEAAQVSYFQTNFDWLPNGGGIFDNPALRKADSFVTIGGFAQDTLRPEQVAFAGDSTGLDGMFGGSAISMPGADGGWFNRQPANLNGLVGQVAAEAGGFGLGLFIGRFAYDGDFDLTGSSLDVMWDQGLGTPAERGEFIVNVPAPGAVALLGLAGMATSRRRR